MYSCLVLGMQFHGVWFPALVVGLGPGHAAEALEPSPKKRIWNPFFLGLTRTGGDGVHA